jgi:hypothetical protein
MERRYEHNGRAYWVKVDPAIHQVTGETGFVAYVNDEQPGGLLYGTPVRDPQGNVMFFANELSAFTNANAVKQSELDRR